MSRTINQTTVLGEVAPAGRRAARYSLLLLLGLPVGIAVLSIWATYVDTSPTVNDEDRVRGWESVLRELPATILFVAFFAAGLAFAVRAVHHGAVRAGLRAMWWHGGALFIGLLIILGGSAENVMTTRPATVKWVLFPLEIALGAVALA
ncbi:MAG: hypothetical protein ACKOBT_06705 [Actinomycetota bacterium]